MATLSGTQPEYRGYQQPQDLAPLVIVEGFLSSTAPFLWGKFEQHLNARRDELKRSDRRRVIFTSVGPVSSLHDRACELFYALRGGTVNYGLQHAEEYGHKPYGRHHATGLYPPWSSDNPLHFLGHSMGGPTITTMLTMIRNGFFGPSVHDDMIASITTLSAPFRGSGIVYDLGESTTAAPAVRQFSAGDIVTKAVHAVEYMSPFLPSALLPDMHAESRRMTYHDQSFAEFLRRLRESDWAESKDATPYDCTFEAAQIRDVAFWESEKKSIGRTWFRSYAATITSKKVIDHSHHTPSWRQLLEAGPLYFSSASLGSFDYTSIRPVPVFPSIHRPPHNTTIESHTPTHRLSSIISPLSPTISPTLSTLSSLPSIPDPDSPTSLSSPTPLESRRHSTLDEEQTRRPPPPPPPFDLSHLPEEYYANDGVVPLFSQWHPGACAPGIRCIHHTTLASPASYSPPIALRTELTAERESIPPPPPQPITTPIRRSTTSAGEEKQPLTRSGPEPLFHRGRPAPDPNVFHVVNIPTTTPSDPENGQRCHHLAIMPLWVGTDRQRAFWVDVGKWLEDVDDARREMRDGRRGNRRTTQDSGA